MNKSAMCDIVKRLQLVLEKVKEVASKRPQELQLIQPRLVAVSKTKPIELIIAAYNAGQRHFGENYVQELVEKSNNPEILEKCKDIKWHFIGNLQRNKVNKIISVPNIYLVETVDSEKLASALDKAWEKLNKPEKLKVFVQINTSGEEAKNGIEPKSATALTQFIRQQCHSLQFSGLMTIGRFDHDLSKGPNPDFQCLIQCRNQVIEDTGISPSEMELSMGMSGDFEHAIEMGSTSVRVGSSIFGEREYKRRESTTTEGIQEDIDKLKVN
uniref:Pyridoxal phosphate homeostasis protein n=1 Tax=Clastoptera arizonana TaxID=38151 RepID=A0A1B6DIT3_9HEMI